MEKKEFNNYKFSIRTQVKYKDEWWMVKGVDFVHQEVGTYADFTLNLKEIEDVRQVTDSPVNYTRNLKQ